MTGTDGSSSGGMFEGLQMTEGFFEPRRGLRMYHCELSPEPSHPSRGSVIVLMHGYGEHCRRYDELSRHLARRGHAVCRFDARGHGRTAGQRGYVRDYGEYVDDLAAFIELVRSRFGARPL